MDLKEFFKPTLSKLIIALIIVLLWPNYIYYLTLCGGTGCHQVMDKTIGAFFIPSIFFDFGILSSNNLINLLLSLIVSYLVASAIIFIWNKYKKK